MADNFFSLTIGEEYITIVDGKEKNNFLLIDNLVKINNQPIFYNSDLEKTQEEVAEKIRQAVLNLEINKKNVNIIIPDSITYNQILKMPNLNEKELISAIKYQADQFVPIPINEANIDLEIIDENKQENKLLILIVAAHKTIVQKIQNTIELAGLIPDSIETEISANLRFFNSFSQQLVNKSAKNYLLVNLDLHSSLLTLIDNEKNIPIKNHQIPLGYQLFLKELMINGNIDTNKARTILQEYLPNHQSSLPVETIIDPILKEFTNEIKRFIDLTTNPQIIIINYGASFPALPILISNSLNLKSTVIDPTSIIKAKFDINTIKSDLPFFISSFGGNLR
ncbi:MAG: pilus assembly protein PilM [Microgenomates group bacterium]